MVERLYAFWQNTFKDLIYKHNKLWQNNCMNYDIEMRDQLVARLQKRLAKVLDEKAKAARFDMFNAYDYLHSLQNELEQEIRDYEG